MYNDHAAATCILSQAATDILQMATDLEDVAYRLAGHTDRGQVAFLMLTASHLHRSAQTLQNQHR